MLKAVWSVAKVTAVACAFYAFLYFGQALAGNAAYSEIGEALRNWELGKAAEDSAARFFASAERLRRLDVWILGPLALVGVGLLFGNREEMPKNVGIISVAVLFSAFASLIGFRRGVFEYGAYVVVFAAAVFAGRRLRLRATPNVA